MIKILRFNIIFWKKNQDDINDVCWSTKYFAHYYPSTDRFPAKQERAKLAHNVSMWWAFVTTNQPIYFNGAGLEGTLDTQTPKLDVIMKDRNWILFCFGFWFLFVLFFFGGCVCVCFFFFFVSLYFCHFVVFCLRTPTFPPVLVCGTNAHVKKHGSNWLVNCHIIHPAVPHYTRWSSFSRSH